MSIAHHASPAAVLLTYHQEVARNGKRGALRRAGDRHGISDETVRRYVLAEEARAAAPASDELAYIPPPGGYPEPQPAPQQATQTPQDAPQQAGEADQEDVADSSSDVADPDATEPELPQEDRPHRHTTMIEICRSEPLPRSYRRSRPRPLWGDVQGITAATRLISWGQQHMPAVQLGLGIVLVWLLVAVAY